MLNKLSKKDLVKLIEELKLSDIIYETAVINKIKPYIPHSRQTSVLNDEYKLVKAIDKSYNYLQVLKHFNLLVSGGNVATLKKYIKKYNISIQHFDSSKRNKKVSKNISIEQILCNNSSFSTTYVKKRILRDKLINYKCSCGVDGLWNNKSITLQLEHKNGNNKDHRLENLEFLCLNCHSQTSTYGSKNQKNKKFFMHGPSALNNDVEKKFSDLKLLEKLIDEVIKFKNIDGILNSFNIPLKRNNIKACEVFLLNLKHKNIDIFFNNYQSFKRRKTFKSKINFPPPEVVLKMVKESSYVAIGKHFNCSDNGIRSYLRRNNLIK